jgi:hypothetical protein
MRHSLHAHIVYLENLIQDVRNRLTQPALGPAEVEDLQLQLTLAEGALDHYRRAYELELSASGAEPPDSSAGTNSGSSANSVEAPKTKSGDGCAARKSVVGKRVRRAHGVYIPWNSAGMDLRTRLS